jgi:hypothetical protein
VEHFQRSAELCGSCSLLIHGRSNDWIDKEFKAQRLLNAGFTNLNVITYDQVLRRAKVIMGRKTEVRAFSAGG